MVSSVSDFEEIQLVHHGGVQFTERVNGQGVLLDSIHTCRTTTTKIERKVKLMI